MVGVSETSCDLALILKNNNQFLKPPAGITGVSSETEGPLGTIRKTEVEFVVQIGRDGRPNLLIDDHIENIKNFRAKGGIGIHHTSARNTIKELRKLGYK